MNRTIDQTPQWDNYQVEGKRVTFSLENYDLVKMMFLVFQITPNGLTTFTNPTAPFLIDNVRLRGDNGIISRTSTAHTLQKVEEVNANLYTQIVNGMSIESTNFTSSQQVILPLFFWVIDGQQLDTDLYRNLYIDVDLKDRFQDMGFDKLPIKIDVKLRTIFSLRGVLGSNIERVPKHLDLQKAYNIFQNERFFIANGSINKRVRLNTPVRARSIVFMIRALVNAKYRAEITKITLEHNNGVKNTYEFSSNYSINKTSGDGEAGIFTIRFDDIYDTGVLTNQNFNPVIADIDYAFSSNILPGTNLDSYLYVCYEYKSNVKEVNGQLIEEIENKF